MTNESRWIAARMERYQTKAENLKNVQEDIFDHAAYFPIKEYIEIWDSAGDIFYQSPNLALQDTLMNWYKIRKTEKPEIFTITDFRNHNIRLTGMRAGKFEVLIAMPIENINEPLEQLLVIIGWLGPLVIIVSLVGGYLLARRSFLKIQQVIDTAKRINADRLYDRIPDQGSKDEIGEIISTLNEMISRLDVSFKQMKQFSADASHELKTPLAVMRAQLENALDSKSNIIELKDTVARSLDETLRMSAIVENLLLLAKSDAGQEIIKRNKIDLHELVSQTHEECVILASHRSIEVILMHLDRVSVLGDLEKLRQAILNLIDNAIKYSNDGGKIEVGLWKENDKAKIIISDSGIGIPAEDLGRIFDRFYRVDKARSRDMGGAGLGLAISKAIIEAHSGMIYVRSTAQKGTEFTIIVPLLHN
ncbi:MAG: HAMP domain-containing protein [Ignavibacteriales bacterium]|nr:HAMP domain-containing protein [Ignavibacteriales bacterium]